MKKLKKILAVLLATVITGTMAVSPVSAAISSSQRYIEVDEKGYPKDVIESLSYKGIVVTMPDGTAPTIEDIGVECEITKYNAESMKVGYGYVSNDYAWSISETVEQKENQFSLKFNDEFSEDEAIELSEKLVIRGIVEEAEVLYEHCISYGGIHMFDLKNVFYLSFKEGTDIDSVNVLEDYPEFQEMLGYAGYDIVKYSNSSFRIEAYLVDSDYNFDEEACYYDVAKAYSDVLALEEVLVSKYDEIEGFEPAWIHLVSETPKNNAVYSIQPTWGDATNDDMIDIYDAVEIAKHVMNLNELDEDTVLLADINRDGETNLYDAIEISKTLMA